MNDVLRFGKKLVTVSVASLTIVWSMGVAALVPTGVSAATCPALEAGDLFKVKGNSAVYLLSSDMKRLYFPNAEVYKTWYADYSGVTEIEPTCVDAYASGGGVNFRPGSRLVKTVISPSVFAVLPGNVKAKIGSEAVAAALYGSNWASIVRDLPDVFDANLSVGTELTEAAPHNGQLVKKSGSSDVYLVQDGKLVKVEGTLGVAARNDVRTVSEATFAKVSMGTGSATASTVTANPAQRTGTSAPGTPAPATGGALTVSLAADTPAATNLADGTAYNKMLKVNFTAASKAVQVKGLTVTRTGLIANTNVTGVSVWHGTKRLGDVMTSINSNNQVVVGFGSSPLVVAPGTTEGLTVAFNISSTTGSGTVGASLTAKTDVSTDASEVNGTFPMNGNVMGIVDGSSSLADFTTDLLSAGGNSSSGADGNVDIGETKEIAKVKFTQSNGKNDLAVESITFYLEGTLKDRDLKDFTVVGPDGAVLGKTEWASNRYVTVPFTSAYVVPKSNNRTLTLKATVNDGSGNWFRIHVQNDYDMVVRDASLGYGILATGFSDEGEANSYFKVRSGSLTLSKAATSPSGNVSAGTSDVLLGEFDVKAVGEDMEIRKMGILITTSGPRHDLTGNLVVRSGNETLLSFSAANDGVLYTPASGSQRNLSQYLYVKSGETKKVQVYGNISSSATSTQYTVSLGDFYAKRMSTLDFADDLGSATINVAGNALTVQATNLTVNKDTRLGNQNIASSATLVLGQYVFQAGSAEDIRLTNVTVDFDATPDTGTAASANVGLQNLQLWMGPIDGTLTQVGTSVGTAATSSNSYSVSVEIPKNKQYVLQVRGYVNSLPTEGHVYQTVVSSHSYVGKGTNNSTTSETDVNGQVMTLSAANVLITAASDATTISSIRLPSGSTQVQLGKWKFEAQNEAVTLDKITFYLVRPNGDINTSSGNFGTLALYDEANMTTPLATGNYVGGQGQGYVRFDQPAMLNVAASQIKYLVLKGVVNGSAAMNAASTSAWMLSESTASLPTGATYDDDTDNIKISKASGGNLADAAIDIGNNGANDNNATSTWYLFHNTAPVITNVALDTSLQISSQAPVFKYTISNPGDRELRLSTTTVVMSASGLAAAGASGTGTIAGFQLWEANASGGLATQLATNTMAAGTLGCIAGSSVAPGMTVAGSGNCVGATTTLTLTFGPVNDTNSLMDNFTIAAGGSRTFVVVADTTNILTGKTTGSVSVYGKLDGATGFESGDTDDEDNWADGVVTYFYTPVNGSENTSANAYSASDSYDVIGTTLNKTI